MKQTDSSIFVRPAWVATFALTAAILWGWAYPLIKIGFREFEITQEMTGSKMLFAGLRFVCSGLIILAMAASAHRSFAVRKGSDWLFLLVFALLNTTLHYGFFYFGLSHSEGARAAILNSMSVFSVVILACIFFKSDRMTTSKVIGCAMGIAGVLAAESSADDVLRFMHTGMLSGISSVAFMGAVMYVITWLMLKKRLNLQ